MKKRIISLILFFIVCFNIFSCSSEDIIEERASKENNSESSTVLLENTEHLSIEPPLTQPITVYSLDDAVKLLSKPRYYIDLHARLGSSFFFNEEASPMYDKMIAAVNESIGGVPLVTCYEKHDSMPITFWLEEAGEDYGVRSICSCNEEYYATVYILKNEYADSKTISEYGARRFGDRWCENKQSIEIFRNFETIEALIYSPMEGKVGISWIENGFNMVIIADKNQNLKQIAENFEYTVLSTEN